MVRALRALRPLAPRSELALASSPQADSGPSCKCLASSASALESLPALLPPGAAGSSRGLTPPVTTPHTLMNARLGAGITLVQQLYAARAGGGPPACKPGGEYDTALAFASIDGWVAAGRLQLRLGF